MANKHLPGTAVKLKAEAFEALVKIMSNTIMNDTPETNYDKLIWAINIGIYREWLKMTERMADRKQYKLNLDVVQSMAFLAYWQGVKLPIYEGFALNTIVQHLDKSMNNQWFKKVVL